MLLALIVGMWQLTGFMLKLLCAGCATTRIGIIRTPMSYKIRPADGIVEIDIWGQTNKWEVLEVLGQLRARDPGKKVCDLWVVAEDTTLPVDAFYSVAETVKKLCTVDMVQAGCRSAILAANEFHKALLSMYLHEARELPFTVGVFTSRDDAMAWLKH